VDGPFYDALLGQTRLSGIAHIGISGEASAPNPVKVCAHSMKKLVGGCFSLADCGRFAACVKPYRNRVGHLTPEGYTPGIGDRGLVDGS